MAHKLGVLIVHGMGNQRPDYADRMIAELDARIAKLRGARDEIRWKPAYWADVLQRKADGLWRDLSRENDLDAAPIRKFIISSFGDAIAYQRVPGQRKDVYSEIHDRVHAALVGLRRALGDEDRPLIVIAHSLGSVIMSNYIWDRQHGYQAAEFGGTAFERLETLAGLITFGSNIALFSLAYDPVVSIEFPPRTLPEELKAAAKWLNFFDSDDVLGYPLKPLGESYENAVTEDVEINVGGILTSWNPLSHSAYWTDNDFTKPVARTIVDILSLL